MMRFISSRFVIMWGFVLFFSLMTNSNGDTECITPANDKNIKHIIAVLKQKWESIKSIQMEYDVFRTDNIENSSKYHRFLFKSQGTNFTYSFTKPLEIKKEESLTNSVINPKNLFELFVSKINKRHSGKKSISYYDFETESGYSYKGHFYTRFTYSKGEEKSIYAVPIPYLSTITLYGDPRLLWGALPDLYKENKTFLPYTLYEFLEKEGEYYYKEDSSYKILWHKTLLEGKKSNFATTFELWFDRDDNLVRIRRVIYPGRLKPEEKIIYKKILEKEITCDSPQIITNDISFSDFHPIWKIPLAMELTHYIPVCKDILDVEKLLRERETGKISRIEFAAYLALCPYKIKENIIFRVIPETLKVNELIDEKELMPPTPNGGFDYIEQISEKAWYEKYYKYYSFILIFFSSLLVFLLSLLIVRKFSNYKLKKHSK